ncbi:MAG: UDP-N-acetylmuramoyl-L-alanine--D-glutamate ligase [Alphaproteobacteria bacterium]|nr:UDP-N-acetylmuramoyl-L-alanine--D-glutamate ligase [Alphaproteobacteria bacterium]MCB9974288.1 UDP-N-acetylmuramoyl-L-alanine--D-glutamate ligase [Rhodospirillales bacterium]
MVNLKPYIDSLTKKKTLVYGLGKSGLSAVKALSKTDAVIVVGDDNPEKLQPASAKKTRILDEERQDFSEFAFVLLAPGIPLSHPEPHRIVKAARGAGTEVIGDIELFYRAGKTGKTIGVTGTNGKSTTVSLIHHVIKTCGKKTVLGGNIGLPVLDLKVSGGECYTVLEMSSYQIDLCPTFRPDISVLINITADHIDRHGGVEAYASVKQKLVDEGQSGYGGGSAVICVDDEYTRRIFEAVSENGLRKAVPVSVLRKVEGGAYLDDEGMIVDAISETPVTVGDIDELKTLRGDHNHQNVLCSYAVARIIGLPPEDIFEAMKSFEGLQHRQFLVRTINGVSYVNDSKATNAEAAAMALNSHNNIYWIVGGRKKETGLSGLEIFAERIRHAFLIGEAAPEFAVWMDKFGISYTDCETMSKALEAAHAMAQENRGQPGGAGVVLLSPACASYDQFTSFEDRGEKFIRRVGKLKE